MTQLSLRRLLRHADEHTLHGVLVSWGRDASCPPKRAAVVAELIRCMSDETIVDQRLKGLPKKLTDVLDAFLADGARPHGARDLPRGAFQSLAEVEAALAALQREGFLFGVREQPHAPVSGYAVPGELADCVQQLRRRQHQEVSRVFTLQGFLNARYFDRKQRDGDPDPRAADHARKVYKIYLMQSSVRARVEKLPAAARHTWDVLVNRFGGVAGVEELVAALDPDLPFDLELSKKCFEEAMLGTVAPLRLARFGIQPIAKAVLAFHEVTLLELLHAARARPPEVETTQASGVDLVSNVGRFLRELERSKVQFTVEGRLYRASTKRIGKTLLPVAGGYLDSDAQIDFIFGFCRARRLLDRSGERGLRTTDTGRAFEQMPLIDKMRALLAHAVEERSGSGQAFHEVRLRRVLLRLLRRSDPHGWHELSWLTLLARNSYLAGIERTTAEMHFAGVGQVSGYLPTESLQQLARQLVVFLKRRVFAIGVVDLGLRGGRPVAVRLSRLGADLLGASSARDVGGDRSEIVVNPDFEVLLFPGEDEAAVVHAFDRFAERIKSDHVHHFRLSRASLQAAIEDGMTTSEIVHELTDRSRVPVPQNVLYSLEEWADAAGLLVVEGGVLRGRRAELVDRFLDNAPVRPFVARRLSATTIALADGVSLTELRRVARPHGFCIEWRPPESPHEQ